MVLYNDLPFMSLIEVFTVYRAFWN